MLPPSWKTEIEETVEKAASCTSERQKADIDESASEISTEIKAFNDAYRAQHNRPEKPDKVKRALDIATVFLLFATALFTALAWWVFKGQLRAMQRQLNDSEIQEAASITLRNFTIGGFPDNPSISIDVVNSGRTRADYVSVNGGSYWVRGSNVSRLLEQIESGWPLNNVIDFGFSLDPNEPPRHLNIGVLPLPPNGFPPEAAIPTREEFISGDITTVIYALGTYKDVFGKSHYVVDCGAHIPGRSDFLSCFAGNRHYQK